MGTGSSAMPSLGKQWITSNELQSSAWTGHRASICSSGVSGPAPVRLVFRGHEVYYGAVAVWAAITGELGGGLAVLILGLALPLLKCPDCGVPFPRFRKPANLRQALWGGGTYARCGCEVDRRGRKLASQ